MYAYVLSRLVDCTPVVFCCCGCCWVAGGGCCCGGWAKAAIGSSACIIYCVSVWIDEKKDMVRYLNTQTNINQPYLIQARKLNTSCALNHCNRLFWPEMHITFHRKFFKIYNKLDILRRIYIPIIILPTVRSSEFFWCRALVCRCKLYDI